MSYSNPMHHADDARAPIRRASQDPDALQLAHWLERDGATCQQHLNAAAELRKLHDDNENTLRHFNDAVEAYKNMSAQRDALQSALQALLALDVKGHQLQDRLQFSDAGLALLAQCRAALDE